MGRTSGIQDPTLQLTKELHVDTVLLLSIFLVFATALIGGFMQQRHRDRVLANLQGFHTTVRLLDGNLIWGCMKIYANGIELQYARPFRNRRGNLATSYIMFRDSIEQIDSIYRFQNELTPENRQRRAEEIEQTRNPDFLRVLLRRFRNLLNTFRDAINESMGMLLTRMKGTSSLTLFQTQDERLKKIGSEALGVVGNAYDPILENYVGKHVIIELQDGSGDKREISGFLREYSQAWMSVFDCEIHEEQRLPIGDELRMSLQRDLDFWIRLDSREGVPEEIALSIRMRNYSDHVIHCKQIVGDNYQHSLDARLQKGEERQWLLSDLPESIAAPIDRKSLPIEIAFIAPERTSENPGVAQADETEAAVTLPDLEIAFDRVREADVFAPRTRAVLRHAG